MKKLLFCVILCFIRLDLVIAQPNNSSSYLSIWVPQLSGIATVDYKIYKVQNDSLYIQSRSFFDPNHKINTLKTFPIDSIKLSELELILSITDSLGFHVFQSLALGSPRFFIYVKHNEKKMEGTISNCYRKHIFDLVDWMNSIYPDGNVITYDKEKLINREKEWKEAEAAFEQELIKKYQKKKNKQN